MEFQYHRIHVDGPIGWLEFDRPPVNAYGWDALGEVAPALGALLDDDAVRAVVFASALEKTFGSGADLEAFESMGSAGVGRWVEMCHDLVRLMRRAEKPLLAAIHGSAVGGQLEIAINCDLRFAADDARLGLPEVNISFIPPLAGTQALARLVGRSRAMRLLFEGERIGAAEALAMGLVDFVVPAPELRHTVADYARRLATKPRQALAAIRRCVTEGGAMSFDDGLAFEGDWAARLAAHPDFAEGVRAFLEKRRPQWE